MTDSACRVGVPCRVAAASPGREHSYDLAGVTIETYTTPWWCDVHGGCGGYVAATLDNGVSHAEVTVAVDGVTDPTVYRRLAERLAGTMTWFDARHHLEYANVKVELAWSDNDGNVLLDRTMWAAAYLLTADTNDQFDLRITVSAEGVTIELAPAEDFLNPDPDIVARVCGPVRSRVDMDALLARVHDARGRLLKALDEFGER